MTSTGVRGRSFGSVASEYDRLRPTYPPKLATDVVALLPGRRVVEVGAGTGKASTIFATHDIDLTCVEPDPEMAALLAGKMAGRDRVHIEVATFEAWSASRGADDPPYDGLISAQAWHWTAAETRWRDAAAALRPGGVVALFWNDFGHVDPALSSALNGVYDRHGIEDRVRIDARDDSTAESPLDRPSFAAAPDARAADAAHAAVDAKAERRQKYVWPKEVMADASQFTGFETRVYRWSMRQSVVDYVAHLNTVSAHIILPADTRAALSRDFTEVLTAHTGGDLELDMRTSLYLARRA
jgi:SAM-dependent methyltransferase